MIKQRLIILSIILTGCVSQVVTFEQHIKSWKGQPMVDLLESRKLPHTDRSSYKGTERMTKLKNGHLLYEIPYRYCPVFFEVSDEGIIVEITTPENKDCY